MTLGHLGSRFMRALWPGRPRRIDRDWVADVLTPGELSLWNRMPNHDQRHSIAVARRVDDRLAGTEYAGDRRWLAAALLHDVGKVAAGLSVPGRVFATAVIAVRGRDAAAADAGRAGLRGRVARYSEHPTRGAVLIDAAGGSVEAAAWAASHHQSRRPASIPTRVAIVLRTADDD